jgi:hypothetical protein
VSQSWQVIRDPLSVRFTTVEHPAAGHQKRSGSLVTRLAKENLRYLAKHSGSTRACMRSSGKVLQPLAVWQGQRRCPSFVSFASATAVSMYLWSENHACRGVRRIVNRTWRSTPNRSTCRKSPATPQRDIQSILSTTVRLFPQPLSFFTPWCLRLYVLIRTINYSYRNLKLTEVSSSCYWTTSCALEV